MAQQLFQLTNTIALLAWIPLILVPRHIFLRDTLCKQLVPGVLAAIYLGVISWKFATIGPPQADVMTLSGLRTIFSDDFVFAAAWIHYLTFDMVVGTVIAREAVACGIPWPLRSLSLTLTFLSGPIGYLTHLGFKLRWQHEREAPPLADPGPETDN
jgi:hypothetical protein